MGLAYAVAPFAAWLMAGSMKFAINSIKAGRPAFGQIGYGGLPSNHSAIVTCTAALIAIRQGPDSAAFGVAIALAFVVILDAKSLRNQVGAQAKAINALSGGNGELLRERMGHSALEIVAGVAVGIATALIVDRLF